MRNRSYHNGQVDEFGREIRLVEIPNRVLKAHDEEVRDPITNQLLGMRQVIEKLRPIKVGFDRKNIKLRKQYARARIGGSILC